jgi:hypothetical protein
MVSVDGIFWFPIMRLWAMRAIRQQAILALRQICELRSRWGSLLADSLQKQEGCRRPIHPGEQLREEFMKPLGITAYRWPRTSACR